MLAEADMASVFCQILKEQHEGLDLRRASQQGEEKHIAASTDFVKNIITGKSHVRSLAVVLVTLLSYL